MSHRTNWLKYNKYVSSHIKLTPHFNIEADIDCSTDSLEEVFVEAATISTPQVRDVQANHFKTNLQIALFEILVSNDTSLSNVEKFKHLLSFQISEKALASLKYVYDSKCFIFFDTISQLFDLPHILKPSASG